MGAEVSFNVGLGDFGVEFACQRGNPTEPEERAPGGRERPRRITVRRGEARSGCMYVLALTIARQIAQVEAGCRHLCHGRWGGLLVGMGSFCLQESGQPLRMIRR